MRTKVCFIYVRTLSNFFAMLVLFSQAVAWYISYSVGWLDSMGVLLIIEDVASFFGSSVLSSLDSESERVETSSVVSDGVSFSISDWKHRFYICCTFNNFMMFYWNFSYHRFVAIALKSHKASFYCWGKELSECYLRLR